MINLSRLECFAAIVDGGSLTAAAAALGLTKAMVSIHLKKLEAELGLALLTRTTRSLALTEAGQAFYLDCVRIVRDAQAAMENAKVGDVALNGVLRITSTAEYGSHFVIPALAEFGAQHPQLKIEFSSSALNSNLVAERFDVAIRLGPLNDSTLKAALLGSFRVVAVAAPSYMSTHAMPRTPQHLQQLEWIKHKGFHGTLTWRAKRASARAYRVKLDGRYQADTAAAVCGFVLAGCGAGLLPDWLISTELANAALVDILPGYALPAQEIHALFPHTQHVPAKVRGFIDFLRKRLGETGPAVSRDMPRR